MAGARKFGAFGGVFTPSILTILGVIMYLRLPYIVGNAGMWQTILIIALAHVISVTTGLSVSSIATDKRVKAGGSYFIISRSLGLPIGGTLGLALFVGLSLGVSLYLVGFSESFLTTLGWGLRPDGTVDTDAVRLTGSIALAIVTIVTFISTSLAIKTQYLIMAAIVLSLVSIIVGNPDIGVDPNIPASAEMHTGALPDGLPLFALFGIFFPAVTGFESGVSMSGDLKKPKRDIPKGTLSAIAVGFVVYLGLTAFLAWRIPADQLANNTRVLLDYAWIVPLVVAGIWGATISSALGAILGAPRILQACAADRIGPRLFAKGVGPSNEPRNALLMTFAIAEAGILLGSLDLIAEVVSMFFMASYGVLNLACAVESWASPDFRPDFKIPRLVSIVGALTCLVLMILLNLPAMFGAFFLMFLIYVWLKRKQLALEGGDTWNGIFSTVIRWSLSRLSRGSLEERNWRPHILQFTDERTALAPSRALARAIVHGSGLLTEFDLRAEGAAADDDDDEPPAGVFQKVVATDAPLDTAASISRFHGVTGIEPNTALLDWAMLRDRPDGTTALLMTLDELDYNVVVTTFGAGATFAGGAQIDVWWRGTGRNASLLLALVRFLTGAEGWRLANVRVLTAVADPGLKATLERRVAAWLSNARVSAEVLVLDAPAAPDSFEALVARTSAEAELVLVSLPDRDTQSAPPLSEAIAPLTGLAGGLVLTRAGSRFRDPFPNVDLEALAASVSTADEGDLAGWRARPETLDLADDPVLAAHPMRYHGALADALASFANEATGATVERFSAAVERIERLVTRALEQLQRAGQSGQLARRRRTVFRIEDGLLRSLSAELHAFGQSFSNDRAELELALGAFSQRLAQVANDVDEEVLLAGADAIQAATDVERGDARQRARGLWALLGRQRGVRRWPLRRQVHRLHAIDAVAFTRSSLDRLGGARQTLLDGLAALTAWALTVTHTAAGQLSDGDDAPPDIDALKAQLTERADAWRALGSAAKTAEQSALAGFARDAAQAIASALSAEIPQRPPRGVTGRPQGPLDVEDLGERYGDHHQKQRYLVERAELDVTLRALHHKIQALSERVEIDLSQRVRHGIIATLDQLLADLRALEAALAADADADVPVNTELDVELDDGLIVSRMLEEIARDTEALPESIETLSEASFQALAERRMDEIEPMHVAVRRLVAFVLETDLVGRLREDLARLAHAVSRAGNASRDVLRLVTFASARSGDGDGDAFVEERLDLLSSGISRIEGERDAVERALVRAQESLAQRTEEVIDRTRGAAIGAHAGELDRFIKRQQRRSLGDVLGGYGQRTRDSVRSMMVDLSYRWSRGVLLARRLKASEDEPASAVERIIGLHREASPEPEVAEALPIFYRQIFLGRAASDPAYQLNDDDDVLAGARRAVEAHRQGHPGALWVTGRPGSGVRSLAQRVIRETVRTEHAFIVRATENGAIDVEQFDRAMRGALGVGGDLDQGLQTLPVGSTVVIESLELWWERSPQGLAVVERLEALVERHGGRVLFVITVNEYVMRLLRRLGRLVDQALATVHTRPLEALRLRQAIMKRHDATGLGLRLVHDGREPNEWRSARLFAALFDATEGYIGYALRTWIAQVERVEDNTIVLRRPKVLDLAPLDALEPTWTALLIELLLHRRLDRTRLERVTGLTIDRIEPALAGLKRAGLVVEQTTGALEIDPFMRPHVTRWLRAKEVI